MPYVHARVYTQNTIENYKYYSGRIGKKIPNAPAKGKTPLNQLRYQDQKAARVCGWKIAENFQKGDLYLTLTYPARMPIEPEQARQDISLFLVRMRRMYKKADMQLKYIYTAGRSKRGMVHFHMVVNKFDTEKIGDIWHKISGGGCHFQNLYLNQYGFVDYRKIANYLIKNSQETFYRNDKIHRKRFCASLNLKMPTVEKKIATAKIWKKQPNAPKGYILDKNSFYDGYGWSDGGNAWEGCRVQRYILIRVDNNILKQRKRKQKIPDIPVIDDVKELENGQTGNKHEKQGKQCTGTDF
ncbi:rolling circle replication-associated protein [Megamonas hypermegale]|uniref:rolling circle replication-associated protein n=1 Tax=Megamonas hypermegale TaxID=158847 RepID=UPI0026F329FB|nr:hypothetical protein [Megamonas hypermegale]